MNQYRCETCKIGVRDCPVTKGYYDGTGMVIPLRHYQKDFTALVGCASHSDFQSERDTVLDRLDKEIHIREDEMNRKAGLEENLVTMSGYYASAGALNWVRKVLIDGSRETIRQTGEP